MFLRNGKKRKTHCLNQDKGRANKICGEGKGKETVFDAEDLRDRKKKGRTEVW